MASLAAVIKPQVARLKALGEGLKIGDVWGDRLLVKPVTPYTEMDRLEKEGTVIIPQAVKDANTPLPSSGIIVQIGLGEKVQKWRSIFYPGVGVLYSKYAGTGFIIDKVEYVILHLDEIMSTLIIEEVPISEVAESQE